MGQKEGIVHMNQQEDPPPSIDAEQLKNLNSGSQERPMDLSCNNTEVTKPVAHPGSQVSSPTPLVTVLLMTWM